MVWIQFTFHHVSIKTEIERLQKEVLRNSHSTMYLLKRQPLPNNLRSTYYSHSTMYLLKRKFLEYKA